MISPQMSLNMICKVKIYLKKSYLFKKMDDEIIFREADDNYYENDNLHLNFKTSMFEFNQVVVGDDWVRKYKTVGRFKITLDQIKFDIYYDSILQGYCTDISNDQPIIKSLECKYTLIEEIINIPLDNNKITILKQAPISTNLLSIIIKYLSQEKRRYKLKFDKSIFNQQCEWYSIPNKEFYDPIESEM
jgi:hypothetical protein